MSSIAVKVTVQMAYSMCSKVVTTIRLIRINFSFFDFRRDEKASALKAAYKFVDVFHFCLKI